MLEDVDVKECGQELEGYIYPPSTVYTTDYSLPTDQQISLDDVDQITPTISIDPQLDVTKVRLFCPLYKLYDLLKLYNNKLINYT